MAQGGNKERKCLQSRLKRFKNICRGTKSQKQVVIRIWHAGAFEGSERLPASSERSASLAGVVYLPRALSETGLFLFLSVNILNPPTSPHPATSPPPARTRAQTHTHRQTLQSCAKTSLLPNAVKDGFGCKIAGASPGLRSWVVALAQCFHGRPAGRRPAGRAAPSACCVAGARGGSRRCW